MRKADYSVNLELMWGPLLTPTEREALIEGTTMGVLCKQTVLVDLAQGHCLFQDLPLPQNLVQVVRKWQRLAWFLVEGSLVALIHIIRVKPGDPAADVLFAFAFHCVHQKLFESFRSEGLMESVVPSGKSIEARFGPDVAQILNASTA